MEANPRTRPTLLRRLKVAASPADWEQFYDQYSSVILSFCRHRGLDESSAADVLQETMVLFMRKLPQFEYDATRGRFRNWLLTLVAGKVRDSQKRERRSRLVLWSDPGLDSNLPTQSWVDESESEEDSWKTAILEEALRRVGEDAHFRGDTIKIFEAYVIHGQPVSDVARLFSVQPNAIYQIKNRVLRRLKILVAKAMDARDR